MTILNHFYWKGLYASVRDHLHNCLPCQRSSQRPPKPVPLQHAPLLGVMERLVVDHMQMPKVTHPLTGRQVQYFFWLLSTRNPLKFAGVPQTRQQISAVSRPKFTILRGHMEGVLLFNKFFPIVDTCLSCEDTARQICAMVPKWRFFASCICSKPPAAHFRHAV